MFVSLMDAPYPKIPVKVSSHGLGEIDGLFSSIKNVVKKIAPVALPLVGAVAAPFTGGASLAVASVGSTMIQAKAQSKDAKKAQQEQDRYIEQVNAQARTMGLDPYAASYGLTTAGTSIGTNLIPTRDPVTGKTVYIPAPQSFFEEYKTPLIIGGFVIVGGGIVYALTR